MARQRRLRFAEVVRVRKRAPLPPRTLPAWPVEIATRDVIVVAQEAMQQLGITIAIVDEQELGAARKKRCSSSA
jgi:hypothetical protein